CWVLSAELSPHPAPSTQHPAPFHLPITTILIIPVAPSSRVAGVARSVGRRRGALLQQARLQHRRPLPAGASVRTGRARGAAPPADVARRLVDRRQRDLL